MDIFSDSIYYSGFVTHQIMRINVELMTTVYPIVKIPEHHTGEEGEGKIKKLQLEK